MAGKISKHKRNNQKKNKLIKAGVIKKSKLKKKIKVPESQIPKSKEPESEESDNGEDILQMVDSEDISFLKKSIINRSYSLFDKIRAVPDSKPPKNQKRKFEDNYSIEQHAENYLEEKEKLSVKSSKPMLPIKTKDGLQHCSISIAEQELINNMDSSAAEDGEEIMTMFEDMTSCEEDIFSNFTNSEVPMLKILEKCQLTKENEMRAITMVCAELIENPEINIGKMQDICTSIINKEKLFSVRKLAALSLLEVFIEILPMYQIHDHNMKIKLKKETFQLYKFEDALLCSYKNYLKKLLKLVECLLTQRSNKILKDDFQLAEVGVTCLCQLISCHSNFNYSENISDLLVKLSLCNYANIRTLVKNALAVVFKQDIKGEITLKIMRQISKLIQKKGYNLYPELLESFMSLRIKEVHLDQAIEMKRKEKKLNNFKSNILQLSKKERKRKKRLEALDKELLETRAEESKAIVNKNIAEVTNIMFMCYFRILKNSHNKKVITVTLQGLAKFSNCISIDFFVDMLNILNVLMENETLGYKEHLYCIQTAFTILINQIDALSIDLLRFYKYLYKFMMEIPKHPQYFDPLVETLNLIIVNQRRKISRDRLSAFTKRLVIIALHLNGEKLMNCLKLIRTIVQLSGSSLSCFEHSSNERDGEYLPELDEPDNCNAVYAVLWEMVLLRRSYACLDCKIIDYILKGGSGVDNASFEVAKMSNEDLEPLFSPITVLETFISSKSFIKSPNLKSKVRRNDECKVYCKQLLKKSASGIIFC